MASNVVNNHYKNSISNQYNYNMEQMKSQKMSKIEKKKIENKMNETIHYTTKKLNCETMNRICN